MLVPLSVEIPGRPFADGEAEVIRSGLSECLSAEDPGIGVEREGLAFGDFGAIDPTVLQLLVALSSSSVLAVVVEKVIDYFAARARARNSPIRLTVGETTLEIPGDADAAAIRAAVGALQDAAARQAGDGG